MICYAMVKSKKNEIRKFETKLILNRTIARAFLKRNVLSCFLKIWRLLLVLIINGSESPKTGAA